jgi:hypothetical protein
MIDRFIFHGSAVAMQSRIREPFDEIIPIQAASALPESGGYGSARVDNYRFHEIVSCAAAYSQVAGAKSQTGSHDMTATVAIEKLNLLNVVTADRIVARIASKHPADRRPGEEYPPDEPSITPLGSYFENLRIAGYPVEIELATDTFSVFDTTRRVREGYEKNPAFQKEFDQLNLTARPEGFREQAIPERNGVIACSLVRSLTLKGDSRGLLKSNGHFINVGGFGTIRLAEFKISQGLRRITMLQVELGSMPEGNFLSAIAEGNGTDW